MLCDQQYRRQMKERGDDPDALGVLRHSSAHLLAEAAGRPLDPQRATPLEWREYVQARTGVRAPERMTDGADASFTPFSSGYDPADAVDRAVMATRTAVFPMHGLFPGA